VVGSRAPAFSSRRLVVSDGGPNTSEVVPCQLKDGEISPSRRVQAITSRRLVVVDGCEHTLEVGSWREPAVVDGFTDTPDDDMHEKMLPTSS
jgi:hypothetical protein